MINITSVPLLKTANTNILCAEQRAKNIAKFNVKTVLELCIGPSLKTLEKAYDKYSISVTGNDIDIRWKHFYEGGNWIIGDALTVNYYLYDAVVFAPPLSIGCTGKRSDALSILKVNPSYFSFIDKVLYDNYKGLVVLVLPGRSWATKQDRKEYYHLYNILSKNFKISEYPLSKNVIKYIDLFLERVDNAC